MNSIKKNRKLIITISLIIVIFFIIPIIIYVFYLIGSNPNLNKDRSVIIDNQSEYNKDIDPNIFKQISSSTYGIAILNDSSNAKNYHAKIRKDSFIKEDFLMSFILDIESINVSFKASQATNIYGNLLSDAAIECVSDDKKIYSKDCNDLSFNRISKEQSTKLNIIYDLPLYGLNFFIDPGGENKDGTMILNIKYGEEKNKQEALDMIKYYGFNPNDYEIKYIKL